MNTQESYQDRYKRAKERVGELRGFYSHLCIFILVNLGLLGLNYYQNELREPWFLFATFGWGIGLVSHAAATFSWNPFITKDWEERKIQEILDKES